MLKEEIKKKGLSIKFLEQEMNLPKNTLYNLVNGGYKLPEKHLPIIRKVFRKHKIKFATTLQT